MIVIGPYIVHTTDEQLGVKAAEALNRRAEQKSLRPRGHVVVEGERIQYELRYPPEQSRAL